MTAVDGLLPEEEVLRASEHAAGIVLRRQLGDRTAHEEQTRLGLLRVAALQQTASLLFRDGFSVDQWFRSDEQPTPALQTTAAKSLQAWQGYFDAGAAESGDAACENLVLFAAAGLIADSPSDVRSALRRREIRSWADRNDRKRLPWDAFVRATASYAMVLLVRQEHHGDVQIAGDVIRELASLQSHAEPRWLNANCQSATRSLGLLGVYHVGEAVVLLSEFLLSGAVVREGRVRHDIAADLQRLLLQADEHAERAGDADLRLWVIAAGIVLSKLRASSLWVQARGVSARIDALVTRLSDNARAQPVFSLLPSQQEAMRQSLLDPTRVAVILQMPTSAGKTLLAEFAIVQTFDAYKEKSKVVYLVPTRALATQVQRTLREDMSHLGLSVSAAGSAFEEDPFELRLLSDSDSVIVSTPEKLDLLLRAHPDWFDDLRLVVVDEAHLLSDGERGVRLELLLANLRREHPATRLLLLTPFVNNPDEIRRWLSPERGGSISVQWRPTTIAVGVAKFAGSGKKRALTIDWVGRVGNKPLPASTVIPTTEKADSLSTTTDRVLSLANRFDGVGTVLALFSASRAEAERAAVRLASTRELVQSSPELRVAVSLARAEYGDGSPLARCLERGVAYHHSALSSVMRYLVEDLVRSKSIRFVAATSTLAQGMNFPVAAVVIHSVHKPLGGGELRRNEFWNIAGRAGREGLTETGYVVFADPARRRRAIEYCNAVSDQIVSGLLAVVDVISPSMALKDAYREHTALRPFIQYLAHAAARSSTSEALRNLDELIQQSLANQQASDARVARRLSEIGRAYLEELRGSSAGVLRNADVSGLSTFSFAELYAKMRGDPVLAAGPTAIQATGIEGLRHLVDALKWIPELELAIGFGSGPMDVETVAQVVGGWISGKSVAELARVFPGASEEERIRKAAGYVFGTVSQTISWGTHAYLRGWRMTPEGKTRDVPPADVMLPALVQFGVPSTEGAVAALLGIPRQLAEQFGSIYRSRVGNLTPDSAATFRKFVESADSRVWEDVVGGSRLKGVDPGDVRSVVRRMQGLPT